MYTIITGYKNVKYISMISFTMKCRFSVDPELRRINSDELIVYDVEVSEFIQRKIIRMKTEQPAPLLSDVEVNLKIFQNKQKSYKMVLILSMIDEYLESHNQDVPFNKVAERFLAYYQHSNGIGRKVDSPPNGAAFS